MKSQRLILALSLTLTFVEAFAQTRQAKYNLDSLVNVNSSYKNEDATKLRLLNILSITYRNSSNADKGLQTAEQAVALSQKLKNDQELAYAYHNKAASLISKNDGKQALQFLENAKLINEQLQNQLAVSDNLSLMGKCYRMLSNPKKAIEMNEQALAICESLGNMYGVASNYKSISSAYLLTQDFKNARALLEKELAVNLKHGEKIEIANNYTNIGRTSHNLADYTLALKSFEKALFMYEELSDITSTASALGQIGLIYSDMGEYNTAMEYLLKAIKMNEELGLKSEVSGNYSNLARVYQRLGDLPKSTSLYKKALAMDVESGNKDWVISHHIGLASNYSSLSDYPKSLEHLQQGLIISEQINNKKKMAIILGNIGVIYENIANYPLALEYHQRALVVNEQLGFKTGICANLSNISNVYRNLDDTSCARLGFTSSQKQHKALEYQKEALVIYEQMQSKKGMAICYSNMGNIYSSLDDPESALAYYRKAIEANSNIGDDNVTSANLENIGGIYLYSNDTKLLMLNVKPEHKFDSVFHYLNQSMQLSKKIDNTAQVMTIWLKLSDAYEQQKQYGKAYEAYKNHIVLRDSITGEKVKKNIERKEMQYEFDKKETALKYEKQLSDEKLIRSEQELGLRQKALELSNKEKDLQRLAYLKEKAEKQEKEKQLTLAEREKQLQSSQLEVLGKEKELQNAQLETQQQEIETKNAQRNLFIAGTALMLLLASSIFVGLKRTAKEKKRSEELLLNILPEEVADELKQKGEAEAKLIENVTVLFTDFKGFTALSEKLSPKELVRDLHECFTAFDNIMQKHRLEKIKTIGDAYMAAGGLPTPNNTHAIDTVRAALEIKKFIDEGKAKKLAVNQPFFELRIGIHTGPVVAGIVGVKKFSYDIWGDTVNIASRMESSGEVGKVNISESTYELVKNKFTCEYRGEIESKGKGKVKMYFVDASASLN